MPSIAIAKANHNRHPIQTTMIQGATVNISHSNLNMTNRQVNETAPERRNALDLLRTRCSFAALVDANARYDHPRCAEATRRKIMQKMEDWIRHDHHSVPSSIFWLYGGAGVGKSALAQTLAEKFKTDGGLAASFFFFKADANRSDGDRLIPTLALQLIHSFPGITPFLEEKLLANPNLFEKNRYAQMVELLVEPLIALSLEEADAVQSNTAFKLSHPRLVVIDGLDECSDPDIQCDLLQIIASAIPHLPYPLRFLVTSRPESHITRVFQHDLREVARYNLSDDPDADNDIRTFLEAEFAKIRRTHPLRRHLPSRWPPWGSISSIVERSSSHFIYASTVIRFIQSPQHRPDDRLQVVLGLKQPYEKDRPYAPLDSLYRLIFLGIQDPGQLEKIHCALGIMYLRSLKSGLFALQWISDRHAIEVLLELRPGDIFLLFDRLLSLVTFDNNEIWIFHKSLFDYLLDSSRSGDFQLDLSLAHETAANHILKAIKLRDSWDSLEFRDFAYHCQFARLNHTLMTYLRSLARDPKIEITVKFPVIASRMFKPRNHKQPFLLQSILYFLQVIGRQDFDPSGDCYRKYVEKKNKLLKSAVPLVQRFKCVVSGLTRLEVIRKSAYFERKLRSSLEIFHEFFEDIQRKGTNGLNGRIPIPAVTMSVIKSIEQEHEMFSCYVKAHHRYPDIVISFLQPTAHTRFIHSCHFVIRVTSVKFVLLVTYTEHGVRLSCSEFDGSLALHVYFRENRRSLVDDSLRSLVEEHYRITRHEVDSNTTMVYSSWIRSPPI